MSEDDLPLEILVSKSHHCLDPNEYIKMLPKPKRVKELDTETEEWNEEMEIRRMKLEKRATYMRFYRSQH